MMTHYERIATIAVAALVAAGFMLLVTGDRLSWSTALLGVALVGLAEYAFGSGRALATIDPAVAAPAAPYASPERPGSTTTEPAPEWHATAMLNQGTKPVAEPAKPAFVRPPLQTYRAVAQRDSYQCPSCAHFTVHHSDGFSCSSCGASWTWSSGEHWPNVRPQPHLQEVT